MSTIRPFRATRIEHSPHEWKTLRKLWWLHSIERESITMTTKDNATSVPREIEPWVNTAAACEHLGISSPTLRRWIKAEKLKPKRTPTGEFRFRRSELDALLD